MRFQQWVLRQFGEVLTLTQTVDVCTQVAIILIYQRAIEVSTQ